MLSVLRLGRRQKCLTNSSGLLRGHQSQLAEGAAAAKRVKELKVPLGPFLESNGKGTFPSKQMHETVNESSMSPRSANVLCKGTCKLSHMHKHSKQCGKPSVAMETAILKTEDPRDSSKLHNTHTHTRKVLKSEEETVNAPRQIHVE